MTTLCERRHTGNISRSFGLLLFSGLFLATVFLIAPQYGQLSMSTPLDSLLSLRIVPYMAGFFVLGGLLFLLHALTHVHWHLQVARWISLAATSIAGGVLIAASWESYHVLEKGYWRLSNMYEVTILLLFLVGAIGLWLEQSTRKAGLGAFLAPLFIAGTIFMIWLADIGQAGAQELIPALQSIWLPWHVLANFIGYGCFMVAAAAGSLFLVRRWQDNRGKKSFLPTTEEADLLAYRAITLGLPVFTLAIILGSVWAYEAWGGYWSWDPKETWALIVWLTYAGYLHARMTHGWQGTKLSIWAVIGFFITLFCFVGVNMFLSGLHSYGQLT